MTAAIASGASELIARGVVAHVDLEMGYGILQAGGYGRVLIVSHFDRELVTLGNWLSVRVKQNTSITWSPQRTRCYFVDDGVAQVIDDLLPTGTSVSKTGATRLRIQTPVFTGSVLFGSCVGLSPHLGRVYLSKTLCEKFSMKPLMWIHCGVISADPSEANCNSFWDARSAGRDDEDPKPTGSVRHCLGQFQRFAERNLCIVKVLNRNGKSGGFVSLHSFDFAHAVTEEDLKKNPAIELYAAPCLPQLPEFPVPACYARIVDDKTKKELLQQADGELAPDESQRSAALLPNIEEKLADIRISDSGVDADVAVGSTNGQSCDPNCETCKCIARLLAVRSVAEVLEEEEPDLFKDLCDFIERC